MGVGTVADAGGRVSATAAVASAAATASAAIAFVVLSVSPTGLSPLSAAVSQWALTPYLWGYRWLTISLAIAAVALAAALLAGRAVNAGSTAIALLLFAVGRAFVGWVNMDAPGAAATLRGDVHWLLGILSFLSAIAAMLLFTRARGGRHGRDRLSRFSQVVGWFTLACVVLLFASTRVSFLSPFFGLFERGFYIATLVWSGVVASVGFRQVMSSRVGEP